MVSMLLGCAGNQGSGRGHWYTVKPGDNLHKVARRFHVATQELAEWNNIKDVNSIHTGSRLHIPLRSQTRRGHYRWRRGSSIKLYYGKFAWPLNGPINSPYGIRHGRRHDGIDIGAHRGDKIKAAAAGVVAFAGRLSGYGKIVILRHPKRYYTAYAHASKLLVHKGEHVRRGEVIAKVGTTGHSSGPHLHFEVRNGQQARNPLFFLKPRSASQRRMIARAKLSMRNRQGKAGNRSKVTTSHTGKWRKFVRKKTHHVPVNTPYRRRHR